MHIKAQIIFRILPYENKVKLFMNNVHIHYHDCITDISGEIMNIQINIFTFEILLENLQS